MRAMFMVVASVLLAAGLFGCHRAPQAPVAAPVVEAQPVPVSEPPPPPPAVAPAQHRRHRYASRSRSSYGSTGESYSAESSYASSGESREYDETNGGDEAQSAGPQSDAPVWIDGYGREHYATTIQADENPAELSHHDKRVRRDPWHGYEER